jgi:AbiV family abortive infection protein
MVTEQTLLEGSWFALQQAGRLLVTAVAIYEHGDHSTAASTAMFAREELGRSRLLRGCAAEVRGGRVLSAKAVNARCDEHAEKQQASAFSITLRPAVGSVPWKALNALSDTLPGGPEWDAAERVLKQATDAKGKRQPHYRTTVRARGLYVDLDDTGKKWLRPVHMDKTEALYELSSAIGDYNLEASRLTDEGLKQVTRQYQPHVQVEEMINARRKMVEQIELPQPKFPLDAPTGTPQN